MIKAPVRITGNQPDFSQGLAESTLDSENAPDLFLEHELRGAMSAALRQARQTYGLSREHIVDRINLCLEPEDKITIRQLNAWMAASQEDKDFKAKHLPAFCWATRSILPFQILLNALDYEAVDSRDQQALKLGQLSVEKAKLARQEKALKENLGR